MLNTAVASGEPFAGYDRLCGYPIAYSPTPVVSEARVDVSGTHLIVLDPSLRHEVEQNRRTFLIAHECAHHKLRHTEPSQRRRRQWSASIVHDQEMSADCWAAETLARAGADRPILLMIQRFHRAGLYSPGGGYPSGVQRSAIILQCAEEARQQAASGNSEP